MNINSSASRLDPTGLSDCNCDVAGIGCSTSFELVGSVMENIDIWALNGGGCCGARFFLGALGGGGLAAARISAEVLGMWRGCNE